MKLCYGVVIFLLCQNFLLHANEVRTDPPITNPGMLCPFGVEVYPEKFYVGDIVYVRMNFENTTDHPVWAPAQPLDLEQGALTYYLTSGISVGNAYVWKRYQRGDRLTQGGWEKIPPGQKGLTQYEMIEYRYTRNLTSWDNLVKKGGQAALIVRLSYNNFSYGKGKEVSKAPLAELRTIFPALSISPRSQEEAEFIDNFMSSKRYGFAGTLISSSAGHVNVIMKNDPDQVISVEEMQEFCDQISQGTLKNFIQYQTFLLEFVFHTMDKNEVEQMKVIEKIDKWLEPLPDLEQENLKNYARHLKERLEWQDHPEKLIESFVNVFGEPYPVPEALKMK